MNAGSPAAGRIEIEREDISRLAVDAIVNRRGDPPGSGSGAAY
jgi:hypothetical protein